MRDRQETIELAIEILGRTDADRILTESMSDMTGLIELGVLRVDVKFTRSRLEAALQEPTTAEDVVRRFGALSVALSVLRVAGHED